MANTSTFLQKFNKTINSYWFIALLLTPFFIVICLRSLTGAGIAYRISRVTVVLVFIAILAFILYEFIRYNRLPKAFLIMVAVMFGLIVISSIANRTSIFKPCGALIIAFCICYIIDYYINKGNFKKFFNTLFYYYLLLYFANLIVAMFCRQGLTSNATNPYYLLGLDNFTALHSVLLITLILIKVKYTKNSWFNLMLFLPLFTTLIIDSASNQAVVFVLIIAAFIIEFWPKKIKNQWIVFACSCVIIFMQLCVFERSLSNTVFEAIGKLFNRDVTFTGRTTIWDKALELINNALFIGYGDNEIGHVFVSWGFVQGHNYILEVLLNGGLWALLSLVIIIAMVLTKCAEDGFINKISIISVFAALLYCMVEHVRQAPMLFIIFTLAYNVDKINIHCMFNTLHKGENYESYNAD